MAIVTLTDINGRDFTVVAEYSTDNTVTLKTLTEIEDDTEISGDLRVSGEITAAATLTLSDSRLKADIEPLQDSLAKINQMNGYNYTFTPSGKRQVGLIAQEVKDIIPEVVDIKNDYYTISYPNLVAVLVEAVKELSKKVEDLEWRLGED